MRPDWPRANHLYEFTGKGLLCTPQPWMSLGLPVKLVPGYTTHDEVMRRCAERAAVLRVTACTETVAAGAETRATPPADVAAIAAGADAILRAPKDRSNARTASLLMTLS